MENKDRIFIFGRTIPSTSSFFLPPKAAYQTCNEYINNCWDCSIWRTNSKMFRLRHHHLPCFLTSLVPNPPVTTLSWPGTQRGEAKIRRDIYETERSVISCQPPLVPLKKTEERKNISPGRQHPGRLNDWLLKEQQHTIIHLSTQKHTNNGSMSSSTLH